MLLRQTCANSLDQINITPQSLLLTRSRRTSTMTAGVASIFRKSFGKPQTKDFVNTKLMCQTVDNGAVIYGLVTKEEFHQKPSEQDYDVAFEQFIADLKHKNIETLICSAMGCVRDKIKLEHFSRNITKLQQMTDVTVVVVSYDQPSARRPLWNGLTHSVFLKKLREAIENYRSNTTGEREPIIWRPLSGPGTQSTLLNNCKISQSLPKSTADCRLVPGRLEYSEVVRSTPVKVSVVQKQSNVSPIPSETTDPSKIVPIMELDLN